MNDSVRYLSTENIIALHAQIMEIMGWAPAPLRSESLLESAVARPQNMAYYESADLVQQATALGIGISQNQPFLDGNKRTAYIAMLAFLELNGFTIKAEPLDIAHLLVATAERSNELEVATAEFASWLRERLIPLDE